MSRIIVSNRYKALKQDIKKSKKKNMFIFLRSIAIVAIVVTAVAFLFLTILSDNMFASDEQKDPVVVKVKKGDCLWNIASDYSDGRDVRDVIREIKKYNQMDDSDLYPGMIILIPQ